jgi:hypothetical protein
VEDKPVEPAADPIKVKLFFWASNFLGLLCGLMFFGSGFGKVSGGMDSTLETVHGPFFGIPGAAFKVLAFFGHFMGGICMIYGICAKIVYNVLGKKAPFLETLILMDAVGMCTIAIGAVFLHVMMGMSWFTPLVIVFPLPLLRFGYNGWTLPEGNVLSTSLPNKKLYYGFVGVNVVGFLISVVMHLTIGTVGIMHED